MQTHRSYRLLMMRQRVDSLPNPQVPELDRLVMTPRDDLRVIVLGQD